MTSTQTHTPGPWTASDIGAIYDANDEILMTGSQSQGGEPWANATLIAAAPAMLEALEAGVKLVRELLDSPGILPAPEANAMDDWQADVTVDLLDSPAAITAAETSQPARQADGPPSVCRGEEPK